MKKTILVSLTIASLFMTGCGCGKKDKITKLKCTSDFDEYGESNVVTATFKNNYLIDETVETIIEFDDELLAERFYEMYKDNDEVKTSLNGTTVSYTIDAEYDYDSKAFDYDSFYKKIEDDGYSCDVK